MAAKYGLLVAALALLSAGCSDQGKKAQSVKSAIATAPPPVEGDGVSRAGVWNRLRTELYIPAPEDVDGLDGCIGAVIDTDGDRTTEPLGLVENACQSEAAKLADGPCKDWALAASEIGFRFRLFEEDHNSDYTLGRLKEARSPMVPLALACNAATKG